MIAVPREDGGVTVHGSLQCPYYVHTALKRGLGDRRPPGAGRPGRDRRRVRWQGGVPVGHRAPRRAPRREGQPAGPDDLRPPRGHRGDDQAPPGDRPPPDRRDPRRPAHRPGHRGRDGRRRVLHADPGRPVARRASTPAARTAARTSASVPGRRGRTRRPTARSAGSGRRRPSSRPRPTSTGSPRRSSISPLEIRRRNVYLLGRHDPDRPGPARQRGRRGGPRARRRGRRVRAPARAQRARSGRGERAPGTVPGSPLRTGRERMASGRRARARLARRRVHRLRRGQARVGRLARAHRRRARSAS